MNNIKFFILVISSLLFSCEDVIDLNLNDANPQLVIIGEIHDQADQQVITLSKTMAFNQEGGFDGVSGAQVEVTDGLGIVHRFTEHSPGRYVADHFFGRIRETYHLLVRVDGNTYTAVSQMPPMVQIDSVGTAVTHLFGEEQKYVAIAYQDPPEQPNYYRYMLRVNGGPSRFAHAANDKFNDGNYITEHVSNADEELHIGDAVTVYMQCVDQAMFDFWNAVQLTNPGTAAPANPPSNIEGGALGYFSAYSMAELNLEIK